MKKLLFVLLLIFIIRIPSFFEPYWYGDEGIYLAVGQAMQRGAVLYQDIWDNKTPLLYLIYAIFPTLIWAKLTATACVLGTVAVVYKFTNKLWPALLCGVLMSLPYPILEGSIANAELYFTLPIAIAALIFYLLITNHNLTANPASPAGRRYSLTALVVGICLTLAFLLKVPAIFDFLGMFLAYVLITRKLNIKFFVLVSLPFVMSLIALNSYFVIHNSLGDFLTAAFKQNSSYVAIDSGPFSKLSNPLFIKAIGLFIGCWLLIIGYFKKIISKELLFLSLWFGFSLYGALLSNRPYPHYLLQIIPPAVILFTYFLRHSGRVQNLLYLIGFSLVIFVTVKPFFGNFNIYNFNYYQNFFDYISERKTWTDYVNNFDSRTSNNYTLADYIIHNSKSTDPIFVWGDNAFIYVLSNRPPATKFIQAHHLTTIDPKNYDDSINRLITTKPKFIIVSRPVRFPFPKLEELLKKNYRFTEKFADLFVYQSNFGTNPL